MCGLAGFVNPRGDRPAEELRAVAADMASAIRHRGPDDAGEWVDPSVGVALGHRRLAVIDLSPAGRQPMSSPSGRFVIAYNGEIYDHLQLRAELESAGATFRGHSDTEVLVAAIEHHGVVSALQRCTGMFAIAAWDRERRVLHLARDRLGEKPLTWGFQGTTLLFGSELAALRRHPAWSGAIDRDALALYMRRACVPAPHSIHGGLRKVPPGTVLSLSLDVIARGLDACQAVEPTAYWSPVEVARRGLEHPFRGNLDEATDELERRLGEAVGRQLVADVPVGAFLSGGIDSSAVVALAAARATRVRTFSIGFRESAFDESVHARAVARHLGTEHEELVVTPAEALEVVPRLPEIWDEPFADPSQVPTALVAALARRHVTVSLSGDGGDELFCGYDRHAWMRMLWRAVGWAPHGLRRLGSRAALAIPEGAWERIVRAAGPLAPAVARRRGAGQRMHRLARLAAERGPAAMHRHLVSEWPQPERLVLGGREPPTLFDDPPELPWRDLAERVAWLDLVSYLPDDILVKVDRAGMAVSLESRMPLLDHHVVELALSLPPDLKVAGGTGKRVLRHLLHRHVPRELVERPKAGFGVPIEDWLRGPLREWAEDHLTEERLRREGYLDPAAVRAAWSEHLSGTRRHHGRLWCVLMFQAWLERWERPA